MDHLAVDLRNISIHKTSITNKTWSRMQSPNKMLFYFVVISFALTSLISFHILFFCCSGFFFYISRGTTLVLLLLTSVVSVPLQYCDEDAGIFLWKIRSSNQCCSATRCMILSFSCNPDGGDGSLCWSSTSLWRLS